MLLGVGNTDSSFKVWKRLFVMPNTDGCLKNENESRKMRVLELELMDK